MSDVQEPVVADTPIEKLALGRRHLAVRDYTAATDILAEACELLAKEHGDTADQCGEAYLWYGKALLGLSREQSGVLGDGVAGAGNAEVGGDSSNEDGEAEADNGEAKANGDAEPSTNSEAEANEPESTTKEDEPASSSAKVGGDQPGPSNGEANDESAVEEPEDDEDDLQQAWEMLELARGILSRRVNEGGASVSAARAMLADAHLALGEVALESETYDKAVVEMQCCLELQKELYSSDDRRIAETHYQIGLANSLASNFEDAITHFKNAANILETRIKILETPSEANKPAATNAFYTVEGEIKELKELLPEIREKIQDMMDYKAETMKRLRDALLPSNGSSGQLASSSSSSSAGASSSTSSSSAKPVSNISHLIKRKRKSSETAEAESAPKRSS